VGRRKINNILPVVVDIVVVVAVSDLIKVATRAAAIAALKRKAVIEKQSIHAHW